MKISIRVVFSVLAIAAPCGAATINVNQTNWQAQMNAVPAGDTLSFAAGNYPLAGATQLKNGLIYAGNGATFTGDGTGNDNIGLVNASNVEFHGFILNGVQIVADNASGLNLHDNTIENLKSGDGLREAGMVNCKVNHNSFAQIGGTGISGAPGNGNQFDNNTFDHVFEGMHMTPFGGCDSTDISGNTITHTTRIGIELQNQMTHLTVNKNWVSDFLPNIDPNNGTDSHMAISCATVGGSNITISGNVLIQNGPDTALDHWAKSGIEFAGNSGLTVSGNYLWGWGTCLLYGNAQGSTINSTGNICIGDLAQNADGGAPPGGYGGVTSNGDKYYPMTDTSAPGWPANPNLAPTPTTAPSPAASSVAAPANVTVTTGAAGQIVVSWTAAAANASPPPSPDAIPTIYIYPTNATTGAAGAIKLTGLGAGTTIATIGNINNTWRVTAGVSYTVVGTESAISYAPSIQVVNGGPAATLTFNPSLVLPVAATQPATAPTSQPSVSHVITIYKDGSYTGN